MISAKLATPGLLQIKEFRNKGKDVITFVHDITSNLLSRDSNCNLYCRCGHVIKVW